MTECAATLCEPPRYEYVWMWDCGRWLIIRRRIDPIYYESAT